MASGVVLKNEVGEREMGERLEIEVKTVAKSAILQEFCIVWKKWRNFVPPRSPHYSTGANQKGQIPLS